jgi:putative membrane protein
LKSDASGNIKADPYSRFCSEDLILRDELAIDRTLLANERTLLAYLRSAVTLLLAGVTIMHFSVEGWFWAVGVACVPAGIIAGFVGVVRYRRMNSAILVIRRQVAAYEEKGESVGSSESGVGSSEKRCGGAGEGGNGESENR